MADTLMSTLNRYSYSYPACGARSAGDHLRDIAAFLRAFPDAWTQGVSARTIDGRPTSSTSPFARKFCAMGLLQRFIHSDATGQIALGRVTTALTQINGGFVPIHHYNDEDYRRVEDIIALFETAAALPSRMPLDPDDYEKMADAFYAAKKTAYWQNAKTLMDAVNPHEAQTVEEANAELALKLVPWESIARQIKDSVAA